MTTAIYTAIGGSYNALQGHPAIPGVRWVAFLDTLSTYPHPDWEIRYIERPVGVSPRRWAKRFKMLPHAFLPEFSQSLWVDGTVRVDSSTFAAEALACAEPSGIAMFAHPERDDVVDEANVSLTMPKYQTEPIAPQVEHYIRNGLPRHSGLWCGGIIARHHTKLVRELGEAWLAEVDRWSIQDQLSLAWIVHQRNITPGAFPSSLYQNPWLTVTGHNPRQ